MSHSIYDKVVRQIKEKQAALRSDLERGGMSLAGAQAHSTLQLKMESPEEASAAISLAIMAMPKNNSESTISLIKNQKEKTSTSYDTENPNQATITASGELPLQQMLTRLQRAKDYLVQKPHPSILRDGEREEITVIQYDNQHDAHTVSHVLNEMARNYADKDQQNEHIEFFASKVGLLQFDNQPNPYPTIEIPTKIYDRIIKSEFNIDPKDIGPSGPNH